MIYKNFVVTAFGVLLVAIMAAPADAQEKSPTVIMESLPHHLQARLERRNRTIFQASVSVGLQQVVEKLKTWKPGSTLRICFFGGPQDTRARIAKAASLWVANGNLKFDFGNMSDPRTCEGDTFEHIRIGYSYQGYWSLVGRDSINEAAQLEQSMNLAKYDYNPPVEPQFTAVVLHEFGHALGFHHEHQHPTIGCEKEFDWDALYTYLGGDPNNWSPEKVDHNMRRLDNDGKYTTTNPDLQSIMLYKLPVWMFKKKAASICFIANENTKLSSGDKIAMSASYPVELSQLNKVRAQNIELLEKEIEKQQKTPIGRIMAINALSAITSFDMTTGFGQGPALMMAVNPKTGLPRSQFMWVPNPKR